MRNDTEDRLIRAKMTALTEMFTCLQNADGASPFDADRLDEWAAGPRSHGERCAAQFILSVWNPDAEWKSGKFDFHEAYRVWSDNHRIAFVAWARDPWWA